MDQKGQQKRKRKQKLLQNQIVVAHYSDITWATRRPKSILLSIQLV